MTKSILYLLPDHESVTPLKNAEMDWTALERHLKVILLMEDGANGQSGLIIMDVIVGMA